MYRFLCFLLLVSAICNADIKSTSGNIAFDPDSDLENDLVISTTGLGIGTTTAAANLHLLGNAKIESGDLTIGAVTGNSTLEINGSFAFSTESVSSNTTLSGNSIVLVDSSSDNILINLPYAGNVTGRQYTIKKVTNSNTVWITGGGNSIDDLGSIELASSSTGFPYLGVMSDGTIWHITSNASTSLTVASDNLVGWWKLDDSSGNTAIDSSSTLNNGTLDGGLEFATDKVEGVLQDALDFDGTDYINVSDHNALDVSKLTLSAWVNINAIDSTRKFFAGKWEDGKRSYQIQINASDNIIGVISNTGGNDADSTASFAAAGYAGKWTLVTMTFDGDKLRLYIDGALKDTVDPAYTTIYSGTSDFIIGAILFTPPTALDPMEGKIDDVRIYNRALTSVEIQALALQR